MAYRKLGRNSSARKALFRSILTSFFKQERIETTATKAKEISGLAAKLITLAYPQVMIFVLMTAF